MPKYRIRGVDKESSLDTELTIEAETEANARAKAELKGMVVTEIVSDGTTPAKPKTVKEKPTPARMAARVACLVFGLVAIVAAFRISAQGEPATAMVIGLPGAVLLGAFALLCQK